MAVVGHFFGFARCDQGQRAVAFGNFHILSLATFQAEADLNPQSRLANRISLFTVSFMGSILLYPDRRSSVFCQDPGILVPASFL